jgi:hypothetical protein
MFTVTFTDRLYKTNKSINTTTGKLLSSNTIREFPIKVNIFLNYETDFLLWVNMARREFQSIFVSFLKITLNTNVKIGIRVKES